MGIAYFNPQVDDWSEELVEIEAREKENAGCLLFVIDPDTRAMASIIEASELTFMGRNVVLCINEVRAGTIFEGSEHPISKDEMKDLNRSRSYLRDIAHRNGVAYVDTVEEAIDEVKDSHARWKLHEQAQWWLNGPLLPKTTRRNIERK